MKVIQLKFLEIHTPNKTNCQDKFTYVTNLPSSLSQIELVLTWSFLSSELFLRVVARVSPLEQRTFIAPLLAAPPN